MNRTLKIATRQSQLALWQARHVQSLLVGLDRALTVELLPLSTQGDRIVDRPLSAIGGKGLFLKELELALLAGDADLAVHSMKDVPVDLTPGLSVDVMLERANPFDALLSRTGARLAELPPGARVGSSSLRRQCQLRAARPDLDVVDLRGNVDTRVRKMQEGQYEAIVLARAGLERLGMENLVTETLAAPAWIPAVTQGTIGVQYREEDAELRELLQALDHPLTAQCSEAERAVSKLLGGSCHMPLGVFARMEAGQFVVDALLGTPDGRRILRSRHAGKPGTGLQLADAVSRDLLAQGASQIFAALNTGEDATGRTSTS